MRLKAGTQCDTELLLRSCLAEARVCIYIYICVCTCRCVSGVICVRTICSRKRDLVMSLSKFICASLNRTKSELGQFWFTYNFVDENLVIARNTKGEATIINRTLDNLRVGKKTKNESRCQCKWNPHNVPSIIARAAGVIFQRHAEQMHEFLFGFDIVFLLLFFLLFNRTTLPALSK